MCQFLPVCLPVHFNWLIDRALKDLPATPKGDKEVNLSHEAQEYLYKYGRKHKDELERALRTPDKDEMEELVHGLSRRLAKALEKTSKTDSNGKVYHPRRIDLRSLEEELPLNDKSPFDR